MKLIMPITCVVLVSALYFQFVYSPAHKDTQEQQIERHTLFIQGYSNNPAFTAIKDTLTPRITQIIKEELQLPADNDDSFYLPKDLQRITLYGLNDADYKKIESHISDILKTMVEKKSFAVKHVCLTDHVNFFGDKQDGLVIMIKDGHNNLSHLNHELRHSIQELNTKYKGDSEDLYNIAKSERFPYAPHMGLGRIRRDAIKRCYLATKQGADESQFDIVYDTIIKRITNETTAFIKATLHADNAELSFTEVGIFDPQLHSYIKHQV